MAYGMTERALAVPTPSAHKSVAAGLMQRGRGKRTSHASAAASHSSPTIPIYRAAPAKSSLNVAPSRRLGGGGHSSRMNRWSCRCYGHTGQLRMGENILPAPAGKIKACAFRQEAEAGLRQFGAAFPRQHGIELLAQSVQMQHVGSRIGYL